MGNPHLEIVEQVTSGAGEANEDRAGAHGALAWVIDGATDVIAPPLADGISDAAWLAEEIDRGLRLDAAGSIEPLSDLPSRLAGELASSFARVQRREPSGRDEHPSASGIVVRLKGTTLEYVGLGDCALIAETQGELHVIGVAEDGSGDLWVRETIAAERRGNPGVLQKTIRENLWPKLRVARAAMNTPGAYGVFSITPPPVEFIRAGALPLEPGARVLLASDGLTRLIDVFHRYDARRFFEVACTRGLACLLDELRCIETADAECISFPRAKISDDATGVMLRVAAG